MSYGWPGPAPTGSTVTVALRSAAPSAPSLNVSVVVASTPRDREDAGQAAAEDDLLAGREAVGDERAAVGARDRCVGASSTVPLKLGPVSVIVSPPMRTSATVPPATGAPGSRRRSSVSVFPSALIASIVRGPLLTPVIQTSWPTAKPAAANEPVASETVPPVAVPSRVRSPATR